MVAKLKKIIFLNKFKQVFIFETFFFYKLTQQAKYTQSLEIPEYTTWTSPSFIGTSTGILCCIQMRSVLNSLATVGKNVDCIQWKAPFTHCKSWWWITDGCFEPGIVISSWISPSNKICDNKHGCLCQKVKTWLKINLLKRYWFQTDAYPN